MINEKKYIITEKQKNEILNFLKNHSTIGVRKLLNQLEEIKEEKKKDV